MTTSAADGVYGRRPWGPPPTGQIHAPNETHEQYLTGEALAEVLGMSNEEIRAIRPPVPIELFPPRFGYRVDALGINDIANLDRIYERRDFSGRVSGYSGTSTPALNTW
jgi:hypothetical protein